MIAFFKSQKKQRHKIINERRNLRYDVECAGTKLSIEGDWTYEKQFSKDDVRLFCRLYRSGDR